jgi:predicted Zn-dependent peptidase
LGHDYDDQFASKLASVTPEQILKAAQHYLDPNRCVVVRILPQEGEGKNE